MINRLLDLLAGRAAPALENNTGEIELAVAALLIEAARMDKAFDQAERATIERLLAERFGRDSEEVRQLIDGGGEAGQQLGSVLSLHPEDQQSHEHRRARTDHRDAVDGRLCGRRARSI